MRNPLDNVNALQLVMVVIIGNFGLLAGSLLGCFVFRHPACTGDRIAEQLSLLTSQAFALYVAERQ